MSIKFNDFLEEQLQDPVFREEYEALQKERAVIQALIDASGCSDHTQKELSKRPEASQIHVNRKS